MDSSRDKLVNDLLNDRTHDIEFNGHLTNHNKHAVIALERIGANNERISNYYYSYAKCTPYGYGLEPAKKSKNIISNHNWINFLGKRSYFSDLFDFFSMEEERIGLNGLLVTYAPLLISGWCSALTHSVIHLGWALDAENKCMIIEGIAYMVFSYISCHPERMEEKSDYLLSSKTPTDSFFKIVQYWKDNKKHMENWAEGLADVSKYSPESGINSELRRSGLQYRVAMLLESGHSLIYEIPPWLSLLSIEQLWLELDYLIVLVYMNEPGDFLLLHFITSLHAMKKIANYLPDKYKRYAIKNYWIGFLCIMFSRAFFPDYDELLRLHLNYSSKYDTNSKIVIDDWNRVKENAAAEDEEHNPKMVYSLYEMWKTSGLRSIYREAAPCFTVTPQLPKSFELSIYPEH